MKAITLYQPYASLVALGFKTIETRSRATKYRGPLAIHSSSRFPGRYKLLLYTNPIIRGIFASLKLGPEDLPLGAVPCSVMLHDCLEAETSLARVSGMQRQVEAACGDFSRGRFGWILGSPIVFAPPVPAKGALRLWEWEGRHRG